MDWLIHDNKNNPISNFYPKVISVAEVYKNEEDEPIKYAKLQLLIHDGQHSKIFTEPLSELDKIIWLDKDTRCRINPNIASTKARRYIADRVREAIPTAPIEKQYCIDRLGVQWVDSTPVFCTGKGFINSHPSKQNNFKLKLGKIPYNLDIDSNLSEAEAAAEMFKFLTLSPNALRIILAHSLSYFMRDVYKSAWKSPCFCVFLYGKTGTKKTTISAFLTQIYNRAAGIVSPPRLDASIPAAVKILYEKSDCVVVLDDLFPAESKDLRKKQEDVLLEITRIIADGIEPARMNGNQVKKAPPTCGVLFTGEYVIGKGSDAARLLPVEMTPVDGKRLKQFQDKPLFLSTFYYFFIEWFISKYFEIKELLKKWHDIYDVISLGVHARLQETHYFLNTAYSLFLQYCYEKEFISEQDAKNLHRSFLKLLTTLIQAQNKRAEHGKVNEPTKTDYVGLISTLYKNGHFKLTDNAKTFNEDEHDGVIHKGCLCLRSEKFEEKICCFSSVTSIDDVLDTLENQGALERGKAKRAKQIYATGNKRFYFIPLGKLL